MKRKLLSLAALAAASAPAFADLPASVTTAITSAGTDTVTAITAMIGVAVAMWAINKVRHLFGK